MPALPAGSTRPAPMREAADPFRLNLGSLSLDFIATHRGDAEQLTDLGQLGRWLEGPGLPRPAGGLVTADLLAARELRTAIDRAARTLLTGHPASADDVRCINVYASAPTPVFLLDEGGRTRTVAGQPSLAGTLAVIARDAVHVLTEFTGRLRECERAGCATLFLDRSPSGRRRWCSMKGCGERVASANYRRRQSTEDAA